MIDNITLVKDCRPPNELINADGRPFEYRGIIYYPRYSNGFIQRYEAQLKNLRLYWFYNEICLFNSIHKYWHNNNFDDFHLYEMDDAVQSLSDETGIEWKQARVKKMEYGCNIETNATSAFRSLQSYKGKDYLPMQHKGKIYGSSCDFTDYKIKSYDKTFQVKQVNKVNLDRPLLRWEIVLNRQRIIEATLKSSPLLLKDLLTANTWQKLADDAVSKYQKSIKMQQFHLNKLTAHEKRILAEMLVPAIREDLKRHHKETYKRDKRIFRRIMANNSLCIVDSLSDELKAKFSQLINDKRILLRA